MSKGEMKTKKLVPALRFPEFRGIGEWETKKIGDACSFIKDGTHGTHQNSPGSNFYLLSAKNLKNGDYSWDDSDREISREEFNAIHKNYTLIVDDILLSIVGTIGQIALYKGEKNIAFQRSVAFFRFKNDLPVFVFHQMFANAFQNELKNRQVVSAQPGIYLGDLAKISLNYPTNIEQQKIADCLSSIDTLITAHSEKRDALKTHKKGLMQKLFPREGETTPRLRFPEFRDAGKWKEATLGKSVKFLDGRRKPIKQSDRATMQGEYPYYGASGIIDYVNDFIFDEDLILLGEDGENIVSRNLPLVFKVTGKCWVNNHAHVLIPKKPHHLGFLVQYLENLSYLKYNSGGAQPKLNQAVCKTIPLILPKPLEQQKIADFLSSIDALITAHKKKLDALKAHKKGLMQQLFPSSDSHAVVTA